MPFVKKQFDNANCGVLFQNDKKGNDHWPDLSDRSNWSCLLTR